MTKIFRDADTNKILREGEFPSWQRFSVTLTLTKYLEKGSSWRGVSLTTKIFRDFDTNKILKEGEFLSWQRFSVFRQKGVYTWSEDSNISGHFFNLQGWNKTQVYSRQKMIWPFLT